MTSISSPLGELTAIADESHLLGLYFPEHCPAPADLAPDAPALPHCEWDNHDLFIQLKSQLDEYFAKERTAFSIPIAFHGTDFNVTVWQFLQSIPYGQTTTYGEIAAQMGNKKLAQRVGQVVGRNPLSIIVPCHRVVGANGALTGFAGGLERKRFLLDLEAPSPADAGRLF
ncbi:MAG: methylated-DNA--[protein]-cysteine S-methyltransferase [Corynebacterium sp.]|nr:methylated-DNA--[protein]-cysteine S-methyltransferase [Corynebacterium sp.]